MSHPIDDLFKKSLKNASLQGHEKDWSEARQILGLENRKNRLPLWFWIGIGLALLLLSAIYFSRNHAVNIDQGTLQYAKGVDSENEGNSNLTSENTDPEVKSIGPIILQSDALQSDALQSDALQSDASQSDVPQLANNQQDIFNKAKIAQSKRDENDEVEKDLSVIKSASNLGESNIASTISPQELDDRLSHSLTNFENKSLEENQNAEDINALTTLIEKNPAKEQVNQLSFAILPIGKLPVEPLSIRRDIVDQNFLKTTKNTHAYPSQLGWGLYVGYSPDRNLLEGGVGLHWSFRANWVVDFGLGISRYSRQEGAAYENIIFFDRLSSSSNGVIVSNNNYRYYSLRIPIRLHRKIKRHSVFTGIVLERPFILEGTQVVSLGPEMLDAASPGNQFDLSGSSDPITSVQNYNLRSTPQLEKLFLFAQLGYSYALSPSFAISASGMMRISNQELISPLLDVSQVNESTTMTRLHMLLRLDYTF